MAVGIRDVLFQPLITGPLLLLLLRGPDEVRKAIVEKTSANVLSKAITTLKWLLALGVAGKISGALDRFALNHWRFRAEGEPFNFRDNREIFVITGGCSGFGHLMVEGFAGKGKIVVIDIQALPKTLEYVPNLHYYRCDLSDTDAVETVISQIKSEVGNPTILINNAGIGQPHHILDTTPKMMEKITHVNLICHWQLIRGFLPTMLQNKKGHIVTIASMASYVSVAGIVDYNATKSGLLSLHEGLNQELRHRYQNGRCIRTTIMHPSWARTPLLGEYSSRADEHKNEIMEPKVVTDKIIKQVLAQKSGQLFAPDGMIRVAAVRSGPHWIQEIVRDTTKIITQGL